MPGKTKETVEKAAVLKGQEAEDRILDYMKRINRPFGAIDVSANLKGAVPKATTQKILAVLADKGEITQKTYGKSQFYVAKQSNLEDVPAEKLEELEKQHKTIEEQVKALQAEVKAATAELTRLKSTPTDQELAVQIEETNAAVQKSLEYLMPLRQGTTIISTADLAKMDKDWQQWRAQWLSRKKIFVTLWHMATDSLSPQDVESLVEDLGIEYDSDEHKSLEQSYMCKK